MNKYVEIIIKEAKKAYNKGEIPVGCIVVKENKVISKAYNTKQKKHKCINHAEILAITKAEKKLKDWRLDNCELYVTLEPCKMCLEVIRQARIKKVYYLLPTKFDNENNKKIEIIQMKNYPTEITTYKEELSLFFKNKR